MENHACTQMLDVPPQVINECTLADQNCQAMLTGELCRSQFATLK
jgi:hypothetical protein